MSIVQLQSDDDHLGSQCQKHRRETPEEQVKVRYFFLSPNVLMQQILVGVVV
jgi:hypothetical protein